MARTDIGYKAVVEAIEKVAASGQTVTIARVKDVLGAGSPPTISKFVKLWKAQQMQAMKDDLAAHQTTSAETQKSLNLDEKDKKSRDPINPDNPSVRQVDVTQPSKEDPNMRADTQDHSRKDQSKATNTQVETQDHSRKDQSKATSTQVETQDHSRKDQSKDRNMAHSSSADRNKTSSGMKHNANMPRHNKQDNRPYNKKRHEQKPITKPVFHEEEQFITKPLEQMTPEELSIAIRRLQSALAKETVRRETAEKMARDAKAYSGVIKDQVAMRISDIKQSMEAAIHQLKAEAKELKCQKEEDLTFYRQQLEKANQKIIDMTDHSGGD